MREKQYYQALSNYEESMKFMAKSPWHNLQRICLQYFKKILKSYIEAVILQSIENLREQIIQKANAAAPYFRELWAATSSNPSVCQL